MDSAGLHDGYLVIVVHPKVNTAFRLMDSFLDDPSVTSLQLPHNPLCNQVQVVWLSHDDLLSPNITT